MRIKMTEVAESTRLPSWRPPQVAQLTAEAKQVVTVVVSEQTRALAATLTRSLSDIANLPDLLTQDDRLLIAWVAEVARSEGLDGDEVSKLTANLAQYRAQELVGAQPALERGMVETGLLTLPRFAPREEAQARAILFGLATTQSTLDAGFVNALLDPDLRPRGGVSLGFLQRVVAALPPGASERLAGLDTAYARRDARVSLVSALDRLALPTAALVTPTAERVQLGDVILRERARLMTPQSAWQLPTTTTRDDRALLGLLYVSQDVRGGDLRHVDDVARALVTLRSVDTLHAPARMDQQPTRLDPPRMAPSIAPGRPDEAEPSAARRSAPAEQTWVSQEVRGGDLRRDDDVARGLVPLRSGDAMHAPARMDHPPTHLDPPRMAPSIPPARSDDAGPSAARRSAPAEQTLPTRRGALAEPSSPPRRSTAVERNLPGLEPSPREPRARAVAVDPDAPRAFGSAIHLAAKAAVAYRSVAPPRPHSVPPPMGAAQLAPPPTLRSEGMPAAIVFNFAQALGLSALVAESHTHALRARRRRFVRRREGVDAIDGVDSVQDAAGARETPAETEHDPTQTARRHARWRKLMRRRLGRV
jgi:hypothetical protein